MSDIDTLLLKPYLWFDEAAQLLDVTYRTVPRTWKRERLNTGARLAGSGGRWRPV
jgi:hypothetical protein